MGMLEDSVRKLIDSKYNSVNAFANKFDIPANSVYNALNRGFVNTRTELTDSIFRALDVDWNSVKAEPFIGLKLKGDSPEDGYVEVPLYGSISAGTPIEMIETSESFVIPNALNEKYPNAFLLKVKGESMNKKIPNGSYALIDPIKEVINGKVYAVCVNGFEATIKRVRQLNNGFELIPDSTDPTYKAAVYDYGEPGTEEITVLGRVVWYCIPFDYEI
jgi:repressor LexA